MSILHIETTKTAMVNGIEYSAKIDRDIIINFSDVNYTVAEMPRDSHGKDIELIPSSMNFLHELTAIFPSSEYDIRIRQNAFLKPRISIHFDIRNKKTGEDAYLAESAILSDRDYSYIRDILIKEAPGYEWPTAESQLKAGIEQYFGDTESSGLFTNDAWNLLSKMVSAKYMDYKTDGYIEFAPELVQDAAKEILENALKGAYEAENAKGTA